MPKFILILDLILTICVKFCADYHKNKLNTVILVAGLNDSNKWRQYQTEMDKIDLNFVRKVSANETCSASNHFSANFSHFIKN